MTFNETPIRELVGRKFLVVARERLEYVTTERISPGGTSGTSGYSGTNGMILGLKKVELINYKSIKILALSKTAAYVCVKDLTWKNDEGHWYDVGNFLEAYEIIEEI